MSDLHELMTSYAADMTNELRKIRATLTHRLSKGEALEEAVRRFLNGQLPSSLGVTHGEIIDRTGNHSGQLDVIIYDRLRTPILYTSGEDGHQVLPAEGVLAAIEVKTSVQPSTLPSIKAHMEKVKSLKKSSYFPMPISYKTNVHGDSRDVFPILYFVLAFEGGSWADLANALNGVQAHTAVDQRIDNVVCLEPGYVILNADMGRIGGPQAEWTYSATPTSATVMFGAEQKNALGMWYLAVLSHLTQWQTPPIDLRPYFLASH